MILLHKINLFQFRNYPQASYNIDAQVTCISGKNGSGKTNLLDAVYTLCYTKSYFSSLVQATVLHGSDGYRIEGIFMDQEQTIPVVCKFKNGKKEISCGGLVYERQSDHIGKFAAVMVAPDDIELINEGSELRRKFIDSILSQCDKAYLEALLVYQKTLQQRNAWLKMYAINSQTDSSLIDYYNSLLIPNGQYIYQCRAAFLQDFLPLLQKYYQRLSGDKEQVAIQYQSDLFEQSFEKVLASSIQHDLRQQRTLKGIHKDDFVYSLDGLALKNFGSQGQKKSFLFSLKLAQFEYLKTKMNHRPILLLDDVFEKLDQQRMEALLDIVKSPIFGQVLLTDTHEERVRAAFGKDHPISFIKL